MKSRQEKDDFWDLSSLLPKRKESASMRPFAPKIETVEVSPAEEACPTPSRAEGEEKLTATAAKTADEVIYTPQGNRLLLSVCIKKRGGEYNFYGRFRRDAIRYLKEEGAPCAPAPYFSYIPQYTQLTAAQKDFYLYWRSELRRGNFLPCDESYLYLYIYEILNLPDYIPPNEGVYLLCAVWAAYRARYPHMDKYLVEWVADYCLLHRLSCPSEAVRPFLRDILPLASLKEFYLGALGELNEEGVETALAFFCDYSWRESRYAKGEHKAAFKRHILGAVTPALRELFEDERLLQANTARSRRAHDAFCGSLCAHNVKCRIEVTYYALSDVSALRSGLTAAVKYAENRLRAALAIKSRLSVPPLPARYKTKIDEYFSSVNRELHPPKSEPLPAYEKLYDALSHGTDMTAAREIEQRSWATTRILVSEEEIESTAETEPCSTAEKVFPVSEETAAAPLYPFGLSREEALYLHACLGGSREELRALLSRGALLEEELAAAINEKTAATYGDVILEAVEGGYRVIPDYEEEVSEWIQMPK